MPSPFFGETFTFTQPDGTTFEVRGWGNQQYAVFETLDGYSVVKNPATGFYEIAQVSSDETMLEPTPGPSGNLDGSLVGVQPGLRVSREAARTRGREGALQITGRRCDQRREERRNLARAAVRLGGPLRSPPRRTTIGDYVGLCLLIDFPDEPATIPRQEVENFCNEPGYSGFGNNGSVYDYFLDNSLGRCRYTNIVADYYRAQHPKSYYTDRTIAQPIRARQLIFEALDHLLNNNFDFSRLTVDSQGYVYATNVYYAGPATNNWGEGLWPHAYHLGRGVRLAPGKYACDYQFTDMSHQLSLGTFCHENGHMLCDYPDLYDYGGQSGGVGAFCLMCTGGNLGKKNPANICAYLKRLSGWDNSVIQLEHDQQVTLPAGGNDFAIFSKTGSEYFIIENRVKSRRDTVLPDEGLAIWHIDEFGHNDNEQREPGRHYEASLEQADGNFSLERTSHPFGDSTDLFGQHRKRFADDTTPDSKWWDGSASNLEIFDISDPGQLVSFSTRLFAKEKHLIRGESSPALDIPDNRAAGISDTILITQSASISAIRCTVDITHTYRGDLRISLLPPGAEAIVLHESGQGGAADNLQRTFSEAEVQGLATLRDRSTQGEWSLLVQDLAAADVGTLNSWAVEFDTPDQEQELVILEETPGTHIPDNDPTGITRELTADSAGNVASLEVTVDISHTWIADLQVSISSPAGISVVLHDETGGGSDDIQQTYSVATTPQLTNFTGNPINGNWHLQVSDNAGRDLGKLNKWRLVIYPQ